MQTIKNNEITGFEMDEMESLADKMKIGIETGEIDGAIIVNMPEKGSEVEINGLKFKVQQVTKSGNVVLEPKGK
jgi:hypothetical protein